MQSHTRGALAVLFVLSCAASPAFGGSCDDTRVRPSTLGGLLEACRIASNPGDTPSLSREIFDYAFEDAGDLFWVAYYWKDESKDGRFLPGRLNVLLLDKATGSWRKRTFDKQELPRSARMPETFGIGSVMRVKHAARYLYIDTHYNPSAGGLVVLTTDLRPATVLWGWFLFSLPGGAVVYHRSQVHFAPTHPMQLAVYDPASDSDRVLYPVTPYDAPRLAFMAAMKLAYDSAGAQWCMSNNHHCDPEEFSSSWRDAWSVNAEAGKAAFLVQFGESCHGDCHDRPDTSVPPVRVIVTCTNVATPAHLACSEREWRLWADAHPGLSEQDMVNLAAR